MWKFHIEGGHPLNGSVRPGGNKNEALPALMTCLLTDEVVCLKRIPRIGDVLTVCDTLADLGVEVEWTSEDSLSLCAKNNKHYKPDKELCSHVRASILFLGPLLSRFGKVELPLPGGDVIGARRIDTHFEGMELLGAKLNFGNPITGELKTLTGTDLYLDEPSVTATENLLLLSVRCQGKTVIHNAASEPHVSGLCRLLNRMGAKVSGIGSNRLEIQGVEKLNGAEHQISSDFMEVGSFLCLGAIGRGKITIEDVETHDLRFILKTLSRLGIEPLVSESSLQIDGTKELLMQRDLSGRITSIYSGPWPAFPTDLMSVAIVAASQAQGNILFHEKMFEGRMFFTDKLMAMGAGIVLCDPHRAVISGPSRLSGSRMSSPDVRAGMALLMAAAIAHGTSEILNIDQIERGYFQIEKKLEALGAAIKKVSA
ncbi:MAG: UDP-N-acetylglucosamine 1-carboxyvinyltransferase [Oligoflexales bacterium]